MWVEDVNLGSEVYDDFCVSCHGCDMVAPAA
jgi:cytochrome c